MNQQIAISVETLEILAAYNRAHSVRTYVIYTKDDSIPFGGVSSEFIEFDKMCRTSDDGSPLITLQDASGRVYSVPLSTLTIRVKF